MKKSQDIEYTGTLPVTLTAIDSYLDSYEITGNMVQASTPTPTNPVTPMECGELVASGEHAGEYAIPITSGNTTTNIYLSEPLRKIDEYADTVDSDGTVTRIIKRVVLTGEVAPSSVREISDGGGVYCAVYEYAALGMTDIKDYHGVMGNISYPSYICSHLAMKSAPATSDRFYDIVAGEMGANSVRSSGTYNDYIILCVSGCTTVAEYQAWLAEQYANGTPVTIWYILETPVTETITAPQIPVSGETTIDYDGTLAPSQVELSVYGWIDVPYKLNTDILTAFPATFTGDGSTISEWSISGNCYQASTPTLDNPVNVQECGELVETGEHAGEYAVPIVLNGVTTTIYLSEPLRRIGDYADTVDSDGVVTRRIYKLVLTGEENISTVAGATNVKGFVISISNTRVLAASPMTSTHYVDGGDKIGSEAQVGELTRIQGRNDLLILWMDNTIYDTVEKFTTWLATQYSNGTPVTIYYVLNSSTSEQTTPVTLTTVSGSNTLDFGTALKPAKFQGVNGWAERTEKKREDGEWV